MKVVPLLEPGTIGGVPCHSLASRAARGQACEPATYADFLCAGMAHTDEDPGRVEQRARDLHQTRARGVPVVARLEQHGNTFQFAAHGDTGAPIKCSICTQKILVTESVAVVPLS